MCSTFPHTSPHCTMVNYFPSILNVVIVCKSGQMLVDYGYGCVTRLNDLRLKQAGDQLRLFGSTVGMLELELGVSWLRVETFACEFLWWDWTRENFGVVELIGPRLLVVFRYSLSKYWYSLFVVILFICMNCQYFVINYVQLFPSLLLLPLSVWSVQVATLEFLPFLCPYPII